MAPPASSVSLDEWLAWLETLSPREIDLGLDRVERVLARLQLKRPPRVLTVGGTNGKGSSVTMLAALLQARGELTGSYTSPHLLHYCERIRINGVPADEATVIDAFAAIEAVREDVPLTYFEYGTLAALSVFAAVGVQAAVLEVGLGGRLDAVNVVEPDASLITNVSLDHCNWLGNDIESIAREKAGIMRPGKPVVFGGPELPAAIEERAKDLGADLWVAGRTFAGTLREDDLWDWTGRQHSISGLAMPRLEGAHQVENAAAVLALLEANGLSDLLNRRQVDRVLSETGLIGRLQRVHAAGRRWIFDGAHNPAGAGALARVLAKEAVSGRTLAICGMLDDKDAAAIVAELASSVDSWISVTAESGRAIPASSLGTLIAGVTGKPCRVAASVASAMRAAIDLSNGDDLIVVAGSFYTVAAAIREIDGIDGVAA